MSALAKDPENEPDQPSAEIIDLTPQVARMWLEQNVNNRNPKVHKINQYARDMEEGRWRLSGEAVKFDTDGRLIDGQNRCFAVVQSGATVPVFVVRGLEPGVQNVLDTGALRSTADTLSLNGYAYSAGLAAAAKCHHQFVNGMFPNCVARPRIRLTNAETLDYVKANPDLSEGVRDTYRVKQHGVHLSNAALGAAWVELNRVDPEAREEFFSRCIEFRTSGPGDPIYALMRRIALLKRNPEGTRPGVGLFLLFRTWNAWRSGEELIKLQIGSEVKGWATIPNPI